MRIWVWPVCAVALLLGISQAARAVEGGKSARAQRVYGPVPAAPRVYGPRPAPEATRHTPASPAQGAVPVTDKVASSTESTKPGNRREGTAAAPSKAAQTDPARSDPKTRSVTIYFVQGEEKQSIVEFSLPVAAGQAVSSTLQRAMTFEANNIEADVDGKLLLRGDVRIRFANGLRLGAQLVAITTSRDEGPVEIVVKE